MANAPSKNKQTKPPPKKKQKQKTKQKQTNKKKTEKYFKRRFNKICKFLVHPLLLQDGNKHALIITVFENTKCFRKQKIDIILFRNCRPFHVTWYLAIFSSSLGQSEGTGLCPHSCYKPRGTQAGTHWRVGDSHPRRCSVFGRSWTTVFTGYGDARSVTVTVVGNGHGDPSSNSGRGCLNFTLRW